MEKREKVRTVGALQFWNEQVVHFRNNVAKSKSPKEFFDNLDWLKICRGALKCCERRLLYAVLVVILLCQSCNAVGGLGRDITWVGEAGQEMLEHGHEAGRK